MDGGKTESNIFKLIQPCSQNPRCALTSNKTSDKLLDFPGLQNRDNKKNLLFFINDVCKAIVQSFTYSVCTPSHTGIQSPGFDLVSNPSSKSY